MHCITSNAGGGAVLFGQQCKLAGFQWPMQHEHIKRDASKRRCAALATSNAVPQLRPMPLASVASQGRAHARLLLLSRAARCVCYRNLPCSRFAPFSGARQPREALEKRCAAKEIDCDHHETRLNYSRVSCLSKHRASSMEKHSRSSLSFGAITLCGFKSE